MEEMINDKIEKYSCYRNRLEMRSLENKFKFEHIIFKSIKTQNL